MMWKSNASHKIYKKIRVGQFGKFSTKCRKPYHFENSPLGALLSRKIQGRMDMPLHTLNFFSEIIFIAGFVAQYLQFMMHMKPFTYCPHFVLNRATIAEISFSKQNSSWVTSLSLAIWWCQTYITINLAYGITCLHEIMYECIVDKNQLQLEYLHKYSRSNSQWNYPPHLHKAKYRHTDTLEGKNL